jgi:ABC-2 type transport system permease protein
VTRLLLVELRRLFARRVTRLLAVAMLLGIVATGIATAVNSDRDVAGAHARARAEASRSFEQQQQFRADCLKSVPPDQADQACPPVDAQQTPESAYYVDPRFSFHDHVRDLIGGGVSIAAMVALIVSASFIGGEWQAGTYGVLLTWEPRRLRVHAAKLLAALLGCLAIAAVAIGLLVGVGALVAATRGTFDTVLQDTAFQGSGVDGGPVQQVIGTAQHFTRGVWAMYGRGLVVVGLLSLVGAALATLTRSTVAALGAAIGYLIVGEAVLGSIHGGDWRHHLLQIRLAALVNGKESWVVPVRGSDGSESFDPRNLHVIHALPAGVTIGALALILVLLAAWFLERRDVT